MHRRYIVVLTLVLFLFIALPGTSLARPSNASGESPQFRVLSSTRNEIILEVTIPPIAREAMKTDNGVFQRLILSHAGHTTEVGKPEIPLFGQYIAVPQGAKVHVDVLDTRSTTHSSILVYPAQEPLTDCAQASDESPPFAFDQTFYNQDIQYPAQPVTADARGTLRDVEYAIVSVSPAQYNPAQKELTLYSYIRLRVSFTGGSPYFTGDRARAANFDQLYHRLFLNTNALEWAAPQPMATQDDPTGADYLIITAPDFVNPARDLAAWKTRRGILTVVQTTDDTGDSLAEIDAYIQTAYDTWNPRPAYVLLLGDVEFIPVHYITTHPSHGTTTGTDLYYFTTAGSDYLPDIAGSRIPASTEEEARRIIDNILAYEQNPPTDSSFYSNFQVAAFFQDNNPADGVADRLFTQTSENIRNFLVNAQGKTATRCYTTDSSNPQYYNDGSTPVPADVRAALLAHSDRTCISNDLNQGRFIINHRDHGLHSGWGDPEFHIYDARGLSYADSGELPVVFSINCETNWFDSETDDEGCTYVAATSFSEEFLMQEKAIAVFGATRVSYSWYNDALVEGYYDGIWSDMLPDFGDDAGEGDPFQDDLYRLGDALGWGKAYLLTQYSPASLYTLTTAEIHHLMGDATLEIWTDVPQDMTVTHEATAAAGATSLTVNLNIAGARIVVVQNGSIIGDVSTSVAGDNVVALAPAATDGPLYVTVTRHNYRPYQGTVDVGDTHTISGCVDDDGTPIANVWIGFGEGLPATRTDVTGCYSQKVADGTHTVSAQNERWTVTPASQAVTVSGVDIGSIDFAAEGYRVRPGYNTSFENGRPGPAWTTGGTQYARIGTLDCAQDGNYGLIFDEVNTGSWDTAEAILSVDLSCRANAALTFWWRDAGDEDDAQDTVSIRRNTGESWCTVFNFTGDQSTYTQQVIDLNAAANTCWGSPTLTRDFQIKFQQYDNFPWNPTGTSDGIAIDNVSITASGGTYTWDGSESSDWHNADNWDVGCVPSSVDEVIVSSGVPNWPCVEGSTDAAAHTLTIQDGAYADDLTGAMLNIYGDWVEQGSGYFSSNGGSVTFKGSAAQALTTNATSYFANLHIGDGAVNPVVTLNSNLDVNGNVVIEQGATLNAGATTINVSGDWQILGTFTRGTSTVIFDGLAQTASKQTTLTTIELLNENFEGTFPPTGWTQVDNTGSGNWERNDTYGATNHTNGSGYSVASRYDSSGNGVAWDNELRTPALNFPNNGGALTYQSDFQDFGGNGDAYLDISTDGGSSWDTLTSWTADYGPTFETVNLSSYRNETVILRWRYTASTASAWYWQIDDVVIEGYASVPTTLFNFYNLTVGGTETTTFGSDVIVDNDLVINNDAMMDIGSYEISSVGNTVINIGALRQTKNTPNSTTTSFMHIGTQYYGVDIAPTTGDMSATTVTIFGNQTSPGFPDGVQRWFEVEPSVNQTADITFYYRDAEENGQDEANVFHYNGTAWEAESFDSRDRSGVENNWVRVTGVDGYSPFAMGNNIPTAITLARFEAFPDGGDIRLEWETVSELDTLGYNLYRGTSPDEPHSRANANLIPVQNPGSSLGASYQFTNIAVESGTTYYWLEDVDIHGATTLHGPVTVTRDAPTQVTVQNWTATHSNSGWLIGFIVLITAMVLYANVKLHTDQPIRTRRE